MKNYLKPVTIAVALILSATIFTGCTGNDETKPEETKAPPAPTNVVDGATEAFETTVENLWNHGLDADQLNQLNSDVSVALGEDGTGYVKVWGVIEEKLNTDGIWLPEDADDVTKAGIGFRILNFYTMNSVGDVVTLKVNPDSLTFNEDFTVAKLDRKGVTVTSEMNDTTGFGDILTEQFNKGGEIRLYLVGDEWLTDITNLWVEEEIVPDEPVDSSKEGESTE